MNRQYGIQFIVSSNNTIYNSYFNNINNFYIFGSTNYWNTTKQAGKNIIGGSYLGGNVWTSPSGTGFSQTCADNDKDGICDSSYTLASNNIDYLPLAIPDTKPPASITNLKNVSYAENYINWTWNDPSDADFSKVMIYLNGSFKTNVSKGVQQYNATGLTTGTEYTIGTRTVDTSDNINLTWVNQTARTASFDAVPPVILISSCTTISSPGVYVLNQSIINSGANTCINVVSSNVVFDGAGYTINRIYSPQWPTYGVYVYNSTTALTNITVKNLIVTYWSYGIYYSNVKNGTIKNNTASSNYGGIYLSSSSSNTLNNNTANSNQWHGIFFDSSNNNILTNSFASYNIYVGIYLNSSSNNTLINNTANLNNWWGLTIDSSNNNTLANNTAISNSQYGIYFSSSSNNIIYNNYYNNTNNFYISTSTNYWNTTKQAGKNIIGGSYLGGNVWTSPSGTGFSQTCADNDKDGICDSSYTLASNNVDYLPLAYTGWTPTSSIGYSATVATGQNTYAQSSNGSFGLLLKGQSKTINNSVILNNTGDLAAKVEGRFNDSRAGVFGLISGANVLNATNFALGLPSALIPLNNSGADVQVAVAPPGVTALDARLGVPSDQVAGDYSGIVVLTFSNNV